GPGGPAEWPQLAQVQRSRPPIQRVDERQQGRRGEEVLSHRQLLRRKVPSVLAVDLEPAGGVPLRDGQGDVVDHAFLSVQGSACAVTRTLPGVAQILQALVPRHWSQARGPVAPLTSDSGD